MRKPGQLRPKHNLGMRRHRIVPPKAPPKLKIDLRPATTLVQRWNALYHTRCQRERRDPGTGYDIRRKSWLWAFYGLLKKGHDSDRIGWALSRAAKLQYPLDKPGAFLKNFDYLIQPDSTLRPWRGEKTAAAEDISETSAPVREMQGYRSIDQTLGLG